MAMDDDTLLRIRPQSTLTRPKAPVIPPEPAAIDGAAELPAWEEFDPLPLAGSAYMAAYSRPSNKPETVLHIILKDGYSKGYAWSNFDSVDTAPGDGPGASPDLLVRFAGLAPVELRIAGRNLGKLHALIGRQRIAWLREQPSKRGFDGVPARDDGREVITGITVREL